jgi:hypothetical protein
MKHWLLVLATLIFGIALAQSLSGTWILKLQDGSVITLVLQESGGQLQGTLTGNGVTLQLEGNSDGVNAEGTITSQSGQAAFRLTVQGNNLTLVVADLDPNTDQVDESTAQTFLFTRGNANSSNANSSLPNPANTVKPNPNLPDPLLGRFTSKDMILEILGSNGKYQGIITLNNQKYAMTGQGSNGILRGQFVAKGSTYLFEARVKQNTMTVLLNGKTYLLNRIATQAPNANTKPPVNTPTPNTASSSLPETGKADLREQAQYKAGTRVNSSQHGVSFVVPQGFKGATSQGITVLGNGRSDANGVNILIFPFVGATINDVYALMSKPIDYGQISFQPTDTGSSNANLVTFHYSSNQYSAVGVSVLGKGNGLNVQVIGFATNPNLEQLALAMANATKFSSASLNNTLQTIRQGFSGKYLFAYSYSGTTSNSGSFSSESKRQWDLCGNGRYFFEGKSESAFNVQLPNNGDAEGSAGGASQNQDGSSGRWKILIVANGAVLILFKDDQTVELHLLTNLDRKIPFLNGKELGSFGISNKCR